MFACTSAPDNATEKGDKWRSYKPLGSEKELDFWKGFFDCGNTSDMYRSTENPCISVGIFSHIIQGTFSIVYPTGIFAQPANCLHRNFDLSLIPT